MKALSRFEFHVSRKARERYNFSDELFFTSGNLIFTDFHAARRFAQQINSQRDLVKYPHQVIRAGQLAAMGLIDEILHLVVRRYRQQISSDVMAQALERLSAQLGRSVLDDTLRRFTLEFPPVAIYRGETNVDEYLAATALDETGQVISNRQVVLEEMLLLWLANVNPAFDPYLELFDDQNLDETSSYNAIIATLHAFFKTQPTFGPDHQNLVDMLRSPAVAVPHSLSGQLEYIRTHWGDLLGDLLERLLRSLDLVKEEEKAIFGVGGEGLSYVPDFSNLVLEYERFSQDREWMPNLILLAKTTYVWLDQLSRQYERPITRLDHIPDQELDTLASWGVTGLWLIGLWERSPASQRIKQMRGKHDAVASAYSLFSYDIADDLGGEEAYQDLRRRAWQRGIRLASDMVPNHMGIDSRWLVEHPDWFISLPYSPFPSYSFNGLNLSWDPRVGIYLEDHYFDNTDAAVVFKRSDHWTGEERFIYHGNDGTAMPWNDTAQLNYLIPEVREAVIQTILHVARKFPIIRFDAAMTLAKRHYQRLWFPEPGGGGDIPSRAEHGLSKAQFDQAFPDEFWRQVVDRVAQEAPDTLLLAEAFWLMEGYFVRTLGMHRVYNSAFMNMLRDEKNQEYRLVIKNTLEFDPEILKRYVNFMNNPDERTAVDQFGKDDKYFGVCTMMVTLPGLPMFGHGQVEGYAERYGMEFRKAYWDERPDINLLERHQREIFQLLHRRYIFAGVTNFLLYDFFTPEGHVDEDVFAYSNRAGNERAVVLYHNKYSETSGWVRQSAAYLHKSAQDDERYLVQKTIGQGLALPDDSQTFVIFRDLVTGLQYLRSSSDLHHQGLYVELGAYKYHVFIDFQLVTEDQLSSFAHLAAYLQGRGVMDIEEARKELALQPLHAAFDQLINPGMLGWLIERRSIPASTLQAHQAPTAPDSLPSMLKDALAEVESKTLEIFIQLGNEFASNRSPKVLAFETRQAIQALLVLPVVGEQYPGISPAMLRYLESGPDGRSSLISGDTSIWGPLLIWVLVSRLGIVMPQDSAPQAHLWIDELLLSKRIAACLAGMGFSDESSWRVVVLIRLLTRHLWGFQAASPQELSAIIQGWIADPEFTDFIKLHAYQNAMWFHKESFEALVWWFFVASVLGVLVEPEGALITEKLQSLDALRLALLQILTDSGYRLDGLLDMK